MEEAGLKLVAQGADQFLGDMARASRAVDQFGQDVDRGASQAGRGFSGLQGIAQGVLQGIGQGLVGLATTAAGNLFNLGAGLLQTGIQLNAAQEQATVAFTTLLGSGEEAEAFLLRLRDFAAATPFEFPELQDAARKMLGFGFEAESVLPMLTSVGDAVSALGGGAAEVDRVTLALGQMQARGKVSNEELLQLAELGLPVYAILAEQMGVTTAEVQKMAEQGLIPAGEGIDALIGGFNELYGGSMQAQSETFNGLLSTLKDNASLALQAFTGPLFEAAKGGLGELGELVASPRFQEFAAQLGELLAPAVAGLAEALGEAISFASDFIGALSGDQESLEKLPGTVQSIVEAVQGIPAVFEGAQKALDDFFNTPLGSAIKDAAGGVADYLVNDFGPDIEGALAGGRKALDDFFATPLGQEIQQGAGVVADYFANDFVPDLTNGVAVVQKSFDDLAASPWGQSVQRGAKVVGDYMANEWPQDFQNGVAVVSAKLDELGTFLSPWGDRIKRGAKVVGDYMANDFPADFRRGVDLVVEFFTELPGRAQEGLDDLVGAVQRLPETISSAAQSVGKAIIDGIVGGIKGGIASVTAAAQGVAKAALDAAKSALGIKSPSQEFADEVGVPITQGIAEGVLSATGEAEAALAQLGEDMEDQAKELAKRITEAFATGLDFLGALGGSNSALTRAQEEQFKAEEAFRKAQANAEQDPGGYLRARAALMEAQARTNRIFQAEEQAQQTALTIGAMDPARAAEFLQTRTQQLGQVADLEERIAKAQASGNGGGVTLLQRQLGLLKERQGLELQALGYGAADPVRQLISGAAVGLLGAGGPSTMSTVNNYNYSPTYGGAPANPTQDFAAMRLLSA